MLNVHFSILQISSHPVTGQTRRRQYNPAVPFAARARWSVRAMAPPTRNTTAAKAIYAFWLSPAVVVGVKNWNIISTRNILEKEINAGGWAVRLGQKKKKETNWWGIIVQYTHLYRGLILPQIFVFPEHSQVVDVNTFKAFQSISCPNAPMMAMHHLSSRPC